MKCTDAMMRAEGFGLLIDPAQGMAGDMFSAALLGLGVPIEIIVGAMTQASCRLGRVSVKPEHVPVDGAAVFKLHIRLEPVQPHLHASSAWGYLEEAIVTVGLGGSYASFARRALSILTEAEREVHSSGQLPVAAAQPHDHHHGAKEAVLHEAQDILIDVIGAAVGLQHLKVDLDRVICLSPVRVGGGFVTFSHGRLPVPAPATRTILEKYHLPYASGPVEKELFTPTGASLLAALQPEFHPRDGTAPQAIRVGIGRGLRRMEPPGDLRLGLW